MSNYEKLKEALANGDLRNVKHYADALEREKQRLFDALNIITAADHPIITDMNNAEELGRRLATVARIAREAIS